MATFALCRKADGCEEKSLVRNRPRHATQSISFTAEYEVAARCSCCRGMR